jgi:1-acyl-sn-glycerol-3-phosphate acyltransferase
MMKKHLEYPLEEEKSSLSAPYQRIDFLWRLFVTPLAYIIFGIGSFLMVLTIFPPIVLSTSCRHKRSARVRAAIRYSFKFFLSFLEFLGIVKIETRGLDHLQNMEGKLVVCNHPSLLDVVIIMTHLQNIQCVVNNKLWTNPFIGLIVRLAGYIRNDLDPQTFLEDTQQMLMRGENIIIFPEGTRTVPGQELKMSRGVANLALQAKAGIQALTLNCSPVWLIKGSKWYEIPSRRPRFILKAGPLFSYKKYLEHPARSIQSRSLMRDIQQFYYGFLNDE